MKQYMDYDEYYYPDENYYIHKKVKKSFWDKIKDFLKRIYQAVRDFFIEYVIENVVEFFIGPVPGFFIIFRIIKHIGQRIYQEVREVFVDNNNYERHIYEDQAGEKYVLTEYGKKVYLDINDRRYWYVQGTGAQLYINEEGRIVYYDNWNNLKYFDNNKYAIYDDGLYYIKFQNKKTYYDQFGRLYSIY